MNFKHSDKGVYLLFVHAPFSVCVIYILFMIWLTETLVEVQVSGVIEQLLHSEWLMYLIVAPHAIFIVITVKLFQKMLSCCMVESSGYMHGW